MHTNVSISFSNAGTRQDVRGRVINTFLQELPGNGTGSSSSKYNYYVETLHSGNRIYLTRPANLNKGFDFLIRVENMNFHGGSYSDSPRHSNILDDLRDKKAENLRLFEQLYRYILDIYNCQEISDNWFADLVFTTGYPCDLLLKTIKWFFIEQDVTYWNYSGRQMLMTHIDNI